AGGGSLSCAQPERATRMVATRTAAEKSRRTFMRVLSPSTRKVPQADRFAQPLAKQGQPDGQGEENQAAHAQANREPIALERIQKLARRGPGFFRYARPGNQHGGQTAGLEEVAAVERGARRRKLGLISLRRQAACGLFHSSFARSAISLARGSS